MVLAAAAAANLIQPGTAQFWQIVTAIGMTLTPILALLGRRVARRVDVVEPVGSEAFLHLDFAGRALVSRLPPQGLPEPGTRLSLRADPAHLHFFDPGSGLRLAA